MSSKHFVIGGFILASVSALSLASQQNSGPVAKPFKDSTRNQQDEGTRVFERNCSRCHNAPDGFSMRISGTIVRHMRVRASLSRHDEELLLKYFNP
jgi:hypothetical protein